MGLQVAMVNAKSKVNRGLSGSLEMVDGLLIEVPVGAPSSKEGGILAHS